MDWALIAVVVVADIHMRAAVVVHTQSQAAEGYIPRLSMDVIDVNFIKI